MADPQNTPEHPSPGRGAVETWRQAFGLLGAPLSWMALLLIDFAVADFGCGHVPWMRLWLILSAVVSTAVGALSGWTAYTAWQRTRQEAQGGHKAAIDIGEGRSRFFAITGLLSAAIFTTASLFTLLSIAMVPPC